MQIWLGVLLRRAKSKRIENRSDEQIARMNERMTDEDHNGGQSTGGKVNNNKHLEHLAGRQVMTGAEGR